MCNLCVCMDVRRREVGQPPTAQMFHSQYSCLHKTADHSWAHDSYVLMLDKINTRNYILVTGTVKCQQITLICLINLTITSTISVTRGRLITSSG